MLTLPGQNAKKKAGHRSVDRHPAVFTCRWSGSRGVSELLLDLVAGKLARRSVEVEGHAVITEVN